MAGATQSESLLQVVVQPEPSALQRNGLQLRGCVAVHAPLPSHTLAWANTPF
jgi:hypothetical protein